MLGVNWVFFAICIFGVNGVQGIRYGIRDDGLNQKNPMQQLINFDARSHGDIATQGQFPYQAAILTTTGNKIICGGTIIDTNYIVTAARCFYSNDNEPDPTDYYVVAGVNSPTIENSYQIEKIILHRSYNPKTHLSDIALLQMKNTLRSSEADDQNIEPINITNATPKDNTRCTVTGWGKKVEAEIFKFENLKYIQVETINWVNCKETYGKDPRLESEMLCAEGSDIRGDSCVGNWGGPLVCNDELAGIEAYSRGCSSIDEPVIYTDVYYYKRWLKRNMNSAVSINLNWMLALISLFIIYLTTL